MPPLTSTIPRLASQTLVYVTQTDRAGPEAPTPGKATETLSQFVARILDQLSLSAWLPSAALVLLVAFAVALGSVLDEDDPPREVSTALTEALARMTQVKLGGAVLVLAAIVVLTMLTQAFAFEAIRTLEGYWGTSRPVELVADVCSGWHGRRRQWLQDRHADLTERAWWSASKSLHEREVDRHERGLPPDLTPDMIEVCGASVLRRPPLVSIRDAKTRLKALHIPWEKHADPGLMRRRINVAKRLRDYPDAERLMPTRLGNVLRRHEDMTGERRLEFFMHRVFDDLPLSMQVAHNVQRNRLDLYCSMVFVLALAGVVTVARLWAHDSYAWGAAAITVVAIWFTNRAAIASARSYGGILVTISDLVHRKQQHGSRVLTTAKDVEREGPAKHAPDGTGHAAGESAKD